MTLLAVDPAQIIHQIQRALDGSFHVVLIWDSGAQIHTWGTLTSVVVLLLAFVGFSRVVDWLWGMLKRVARRSGPSGAA